jgi:hypothetical protein
MIKMVPRGVSSTADAYLTPVLGAYLEGFYSGFEGGRKGNLRVEFMGSDGGLLDLAVGRSRAMSLKARTDSPFTLQNFSGLRSILSGPAGGVVGYALTSWDAKERSPVIGFDVGGTSTDVSRYDGKYELVYETTTAGIGIQSPQLDINTVRPFRWICRVHLSADTAGCYSLGRCWWRIVPDLPQRHVQRWTRERGRPPWSCLLPVRACFFAPRGTHSLTFISHRFTEKEGRWL